MNMTKEEELKKEFESFIDKMLSEWQENADKAKVHDDTETVKAEYIKCNIAKVIKTIYNVKYKQVYGGN